MCDRLALYVQYRFQISLRVCQYGVSDTEGA